MFKAMRRAAAVLAVLCAPLTAHAQNPAATAEPDFVKVDTAQAFLAAITAGRPHIIVTDDLDVSTATNAGGGGIEIGGDVLSITVRTPP